MRQIMRERRNEVKHLTLDQGREHQIHTLCGNIRSGLLTRDDSLFDLKLPLFQLATRFAGSRLSGMIIAKLSVVVHISPVLI